MVRRVTDCSLIGPCAHPARPFQSARLMAAGCLALALLAGTAQAKRSAGTLPLGVSVGVANVQANSLTVVLRMSTRPGARCSPAVSAGKLSFPLPQVVSSKRGSATVRWQVESGAPSGRWTFRVLCTQGHASATKVAHSRIRVAPGGNAALVAPGSLDVATGATTAARPSQAAGGKGAGGNPFPAGWCTWGAWDKAQWLGNAVSGNANEWAAQAANTGLSVGTVPAVDAVYVNTTGYGQVRGGYGHVGVVTRVNNSTNFDMVDMNGGAFKPSPPAEVGVTYDFGTFKNRANKSTGEAIRFIYKPAGPTPGDTWSGGTRPGGSTNPTGVGTRLLGDVDGDGRQDAVVMFKDSGTAMVALSLPQGGFGSPTKWSFGHSNGADRYFLADANGDSRADLVAFFAAQGDWKVSLSSGTGFFSPTAWAHGHGVGTARQWVADTTGDGKADAVTFDPGSGDWYVSASDGSGFQTFKRWISGHGVGTTDQAVGDTNGDGKADAAVWIAGDGTWHVGLSSGAAFTSPGRWTIGHGQDSNQRFLADANGDGKDDEVFFRANDGVWRVGTSSGSGFFTPTDWAIGHGVGTTERLLGDVNGDKRDDVVTFDRATGDWYASLSSGSGFSSPQRWATGHGAGS